MAQQRTYKRRQHFIKKEYQTKFILKFCLLVFGGAIISTGLLLLLSQGTLTSSFEHSRLVIRNTAFSILPSVILTNIITLALITVASIFVVLYVSHKIAGPMFRFEKELKAIAQGDLTTKIILRKDDQFKDVAESINNMTSSLCSRALSLQREVKEILDLAYKETVSEQLLERLRQFDQNIQSQLKSC